MTDTNPLAALIALADTTWEVSAVLMVDAHTEPVSGTPDVVGTYLIEAGCGTRHWRLRTTPAVDRGAEGFVASGPPIVDLRGQTGSPDSLMSLIALLTGRMT